MSCGSKEKLNLEDHPPSNVILGLKGKLSKNIDLRGSREVRFSRLLAYCSNH